MKILAKRMTTDEFGRDCRRLDGTARHPTTGKPFADMSYQPMLELLAFLSGRWPLRCALCKDRPPHRSGARVGLRPRASHDGKLDKASNEATARGWTIVGMKDDWKTIFPKRFASH